MSDKQFTVYKGKFLCKVCEVDVLSLRLWHHNGDVTWMCKDKHVSTVELIQRKREKSE